ncbi:MAG: type I secretion system permease/ATPase [Pseudomonadota bacterium]
MQSTDELAAGITALAGQFGLRTSPDALKAGLPLVDGRLPIEHAELAAKRAGLDASWSKANVAKRPAHEFPLLCKLKDGQFRIVWARQTVKGSIGYRNATQLIVSALLVPDERQSVALDEFLSQSADEALIARPSSEANRDRRRDAAAPATERNWFLSAFSESRGIYAQAIAATLAINILALAIPLFSMNVYDRVIPNAAEETLWALGVGVAIAIVFDLVIRTLRGIFVDAASRRADVRLSNIIFARLIGAKSERVAPSVGIRANTMREFETLREFFNSATLCAFGDLPFLLLFVGVIYIVAGPLAFIVAGAIPVLLLVGWITQRALGKRMQMAFRETAQKNAVVTETLYGLDALKAAGGESWAAQKWEQAVAEGVRTNLAIREIQNLGQHIIQCLQTLLQVVMVVAGFYLVQAGEMTMGALIAATILSGRAVAPLAQAANLLVRLNTARMAYQSLSGIVSAPQERDETRDLIVRDKLDGVVRFEGINFTYEDGAPPALRDINISIEPGEHIGILGPIGSGKSTLLRLAQAHFEPNAGRVLVDEIPVLQMDPASLRANVGLLMQGADLFHGTIRENITFGASDLSDSDLLVAARASAALDWIVRLPQGFDTIIRERGSGLSGGQRQSVALARALIRRPQVLCLDEPTSEMDIASEQSVISRLKQHMKGRTLILVTHRPAALDLADRLIVINGGRVVQDGPKRDVMQAVRQGHGVDVIGRPTSKPRRATVTPAKARVTHQRDVLGADRDPADPVATDTQEQARLTRIHEAAAAAQARGRSGQGSQGGQAEPIEIRIPPRGAVG